MKKMKLAYDPSLAQRIVDLRQSGLKWRQIDELIFPNALLEGGATHTGTFAQKFKKDHPVLQGAFEKQISGAFTPTQVVTKLRDKMVPLCA